LVRRTLRAASSALCGACDDPKNGDVSWRRQ
jgi:hypothetical protein